MKFSFRYPITVFRFSMVFFVLFLSALASLIVILPVAISTRDIKTTSWLLLFVNALLTILSLVVFRKELFKYIKTRSHRAYFEIADHGFSLPSIYLFPSNYSLNATYIPLKNVSQVEVFNRQKEIRVKFFYDKTTHTLKLRPEHFIEDEDFKEIENYFKYYGRLPEQKEM